MRPVLSSAELRLLKGGRGISKNYKRVLSSRLRARVRCAMALVGDPRLDFYLNGSDLDMLARYFATNRVFRETFFATLQGFADNIPP